MKTVRQIGSLAFVVGLFVTIFAGGPWQVLTTDDPPIPLWLRVAVFALLGGILVVLVSLGIEQKLRQIPTDAPAAPPCNDDILVLNTPEVSGREVSAVLGLVQGHTVFAIWLGKDLSAMARLILGGELTEYTEMMGKARTAATNRMLAQAEKAGADAIINVRYMTTSVVGTAAELLVYGTAVKLT